MPKEIEPIYVRGSLGQGTGFSLVVVTAPFACALAISARHIDIAFNTIQATPVAGSSNMAALWLWWTYWSGRVAADGYLRSCVLGLVTQVRTCGKCHEHGGQLYPQESQQQTI